MALYRKTTPSSYPNVAASNFTDSSKNWRKHSNMYRKTSGNETASLTAVPGRYTDSTRTWRRIKAMYRWTGSTWQRIFYKNANQPYATEAPTIRYNAYLGYIVDTTETDATAWWATDPYQPQWAQMGPGPLGIGQSTWYLDSNGNEVGSSNPTYLWGRDGLWANDTGASISATFCYNTEIYAAGATNSTDDEGNYQGDKLRNNEAVMGTYDGYYIWYKIGKTVGQYTGYGFSQAVYVTKQEPVINSFTMVSPDTATVGTAKTVNYSVSNKWWRSIDRYSSYIEWHELDSQYEIPSASTLKATNYIYSTTISTDNSTSLQGSNTYTPVGANKYIYAKFVAKNTWTDFPPVTEKYAEAVTSVATAQACGPFTLSNATKTGRYYDVNTATYKRQVSVDISKSANADRYELQVRGYGQNINSTYTFPPYGGYTTILTYDQSPYTWEYNRSGNILTATVDVDDYEYYEITARAKYGSTTDGSTISTNSVYPPGVAPSTPSISSITTATNSFGTYIMFNISQSSTGSNIEKYYEISLNGGSFFQPSGTYGTVGSGYINAANGGLIYVNEATYYTVTVRLVNYDEMTSSSSNTLSITSASRPSDPSLIVLKSFAPYTGHIFFTAGNNTSSMKGSYEYDFTFSANDYIEASTNVSSNSSGMLSFSGANSISRSYSAYLIPYSGSNLTGNQGTIKLVGSKVLSGADAMTVNLNTPTLNASDPRTIDVTWSLSAGSPTHYVVDLYHYNYPYTILATKTVSYTSTSTQFTSSDGVGFTTEYYARLTPRYQYSAGVYYDGSPVVSNKVTTGANLSAPTITNVTWDGNTWNVYFTGGSGPYYQVYWRVNSNLAPGSAYDAAGTSSPVSEANVGPTAGDTFYWWVRSSNENLGNTTTGGTGTAGTYSPWSSYYTITINNLTAPTVDSVSSNGPGGTVTANVSGGGPTWQIYWSGSSTAPSNTVTPDGTSTTQSISDTTGPGSTGTWYMYARSARSTSIYGSGYTTAPSVYISSWSAAKSFVISATRTLSFNANGGTGAPASQTGTDSGLGAAISITTSQPSRSGYTFAGWNTLADGTGTNYSSGGAITIYSDTTLYAKWTAANLTAPTITSVTWPSTSGGAITVYFSGGSGPYYQIFWMTSSDFTNIQSYDANGSSSPITDSTGPTSNGTTYYVAVRSVSSLTNTGLGPSSTISSWSASSSATMSFPVIPTITMSANTGVTSSAGTINWTSTNQASYSSTGTFSGTGTTGTSISKTGLTASTTYTGTVTVTSSTGHTASANYSLTTSAAATPATFTIGTVSASRTATRQITGTWTSTRSGGTFQWWNTRIRNTSSGATATHSLFTETPKSDVYTSLTGTSYRFGVQGVSYDDNFAVYRYTVGTSDMGAYTENSANINPA